MQILRNSKFRATLKVFSDIIEQKKSERQEIRKSRFVREEKKIRESTIRESRFVYELHN